MLKITELGQTIATTIDDVERTKRGIDSSVGSIYRFNVFNDIIVVDDSYLKISNRQIGSSFVIGHPQNGIIGSPFVPQARIGENNLGAWVTIAEYTGTTAP